MLLLLMLVVSPELSAGPPPVEVLRAVTGPSAPSSQGAAEAALDEALGEGIELTLVANRSGQLGRYLRFQQTLGGLPVLDGGAVVRVQETPQGWQATALRLKLLPDWSPPTPTLSKDVALKLARAAFVNTAERAPAERAPAHLTLGVVAIDGVPRLVYQVDLALAAPLSDQRLRLDALTGAPLQRVEIGARVTGAGQVFDPSPVASSGDTSLRDLDDAAQAALTAELRAVELPRLDGSGALRGDWVDVQGPEGRASSSDHSFLYDRDDARFEEVMVYFHVDRAQSRLQALGFTDVNARPVPFVVNAFDDDYSYHSTSELVVYMGTGGVDDAEDADIIVHEYGHSIHHDQVPGWGGGDERAIGEGFGDYLATSFLETLSAQVTDPACTGDWDATSYSSSDPPCLNRVDSDKHYPEGLVDEVHADGQLWSAPLRRARATLGDDVVDTIVIEHHFLLTNDETFFQASAALLRTAADLYGDPTADTLRRELIASGVSRALSEPSPLETVLETQEVDITPPLSGRAYADDLDHVETIRVPGAAALRLHFATVDTERHSSCVNGTCDNIYLTDDNGDLYQVLSGERSGVLSASIPGEVVNVRLVSDSSVGQTGYQIDRVEVLGEPGDLPDTAPPDSAGADSGHHSDDSGLPTQEGCGCATQPPGSGASPLAALLLLALLRRRDPHAQHAGS